MIREDGKSKPSGGRAQVPWGQILRSGNPAADLRNVFPLQLQPLDLPVLVSDLPAGSARVQFQADGILHMVPLIAATIGDTAGGCSKLASNRWGP